MTANRSRNLNYPPGDHPRGPEVLCKDGRWWIFNRQWVEESAIVRELRRFAPDHTLVEMAYHVGLWNIDKGKMLELLERGGIPTPAYTYPGSIRTGRGVEDPATGRNSSPAPE